MYVCAKCKQVVKAFDSKYVRCPHCGNRVLFKERPPVAKEVSTE